MTEENFEILKLLRQLTEQESDRFWTRNNVFVTITAGLFAFVAATYTQLPLAAFLCLCAFGMVTSLAWFQISRTGKYYAQRWRIAARAIAELDQDLKGKAPLLAGISTLKRPSGPSSSQCMKAMAIISAIIWLALALFAVIGGEGRLSDSHHEHSLPPEVEGCVLNLDHTAFISHKNNYL